MHTYTPAHHVHTAVSCHKMDGDSHICQGANQSIIPSRWASAVGHFAQQEAMGQALEGDRRRPNTRAEMAEICLSRGCPTELQSFRGFGWGWALHFLTGGGGGESEAIIATSLCGIGSFQCLLAQCIELGGTGKVMYLSMHLSTNRCPIRGSG